MWNCGRNGSDGHVYWWYCLPFCDKVSFECFLESKSIIHFSSRRKDASVGGLPELQKTEEAGLLTRNLAEQAVSPTDGWKGGRVDKLNNEQANPFPLHLENEAWISRMLQF